MQHFEKLRAAIARRGVARPTGSYRFCVDAYANDLLPTIFLSTRWKSGAPYWNLIYGKRGNPPPPQTGLSIFDHTVAFRLRGTKNRGTWDNTVIIGQPYGLPQDGDPMVTWLAAQDIKVWVRSDLSAWYPGHSCLVLASRYLINNYAADFGFRVVRPARQSEAPPPIFEGPPRLPPYPRPMHPQHARDVAQRAEFPPNVIDFYEAAKALRQDLSAKERW